MQAHRLAPAIALMALPATFSAPPVHAAAGDLDLTFAGFGNADYGGGIAGVSNLGAA